MAGPVDGSRFERWSVLGIDEIALKKSQRDSAVMISARLEDGRLAGLGVLGDPTTAPLPTVLEGIPARLKAAMHTGCGARYATYPPARKATLAPAEIVVDRFHVAKPDGAAADQVRQAALAQLKQTLPAAEDTPRKGSHRVCRNQRAALNAREVARLERLFS